MGWWDSGVLDGDPALDVLDAAARILGLDEDTSMELYPLDQIPAEVAEVTRAALAGRDLAALRDEITAPGGDPAWRAVCAQVLGALAMAVGAPLGGFAAEVVAAAESDPEWADAGSADRAAVMAALAAAARTYQGAPVAMGGTTLMAAIAGR